MLKIQEKWNEMLRRMRDGMASARLVETERLDEEKHSTGLIAIRRVRDGSYEVLAKQTVLKKGGSKPHTSRVLLYLSPEQAAKLREALPSDGNDSE